MPDERDPLRALHGAWRRLEAPEPSEQSEDEVTRRTVAWLRAAWDTVEPERTAPPLALRRERTAHLRRLLMPLAATLLVTLALPLWRASGGGGELQVADGTGTPALEEPPAKRVAARIDDDGRLVMRSGSVRLQWVLPRDTEPVHVTDSDKEIAR